MACSLIVMQIGVADKRDQLLTISYLTRSINQAIIAKPTRVMMVLGCVFQYEFIIH